MREYPQDVYLGDGVYASFNGWQIWLAANDRTNKVVALEFQVMEQLIKYAKEVYEGGQDDEDK
jgi:hypothetical protein